MTLTHAVKRTNGNSTRIATVCRIGGLAGVIAGPLPFLALFYRCVTTKVNDIPQEDWTYIHTGLSASLFVALFGLALGTVLLLYSRHMRRNQNGVRV